MGIVETQADKELARLEKKIAKEYRSAWKEVKAKTEAYFKAFEAKDSAMKKALDAGEITAEYYKRWRANQMGTGERWQALRDQLAGRMTNANKVASSYINDTTPTIYSLAHNHEAYVIESVSPSVSFTLSNEQAVKRLMTGRKALLPPSRVNIPKDMKWNADKLQSTLLGGILQGKSIPNLAKDFENVVGMDNRSAVRNARTAITAAQNAGRQATYDQASEMGIIIEKEWVATSDERVRDSHAELDGVRVPYDEPFPNGLMYPADPSGDPSEVYNCRCTMRTIINGINDEARTGNTVESFNDWLNGKINKDETQPVSHSNAYNDVVSALESNGVKKVSLKEFDEIPSEKEIIERLSGGDKTKGSCASLSFAYCGEKGGYDVLDFRGGSSCNCFSRYSNIKALSNMNGIESFVQRGYNDIKNATALLNGMAENKEYILVTGKHAAVTKIENGLLQYLELQSETKSGWHELTSNTLKNRFGCTKSRSVYGMKLEMESLLIDVESVSKCDEIKDILEYINTNASEQLKGIGGNVK